MFFPVWVLRELPCKQDADKSESGTLEGEEFVLFYKALTQREEVLSLFQEFSEDGKKLTLLELVDFLREEQLEDEGTEELAMELIDKYEPSETGESWLRHQLCSAWGQGGVKDSSMAAAFPAPSWCEWAQEEDSPRCDLGAVPLYLVCSWTILV